jgi:hypothetical protein
VSTTIPPLLLDLDVANLISYPAPNAEPVTQLTSALPSPDPAAGAPIDLPDYGLCAYDAGLTSYPTDGLSWGVLGQDRLRLRPARWYLPVPLGSPLNAIPLPYSAPLAWRAARAGGGVLQAGPGVLAGNFAYAGQVWQVLPRRYGNGFTVEIAVHLPQVLPVGTLFYWGTRAANKFWEVSDVAAAYHLHGGIPLSEAHPTDPDLGLSQHGLAVRLAPGGAVVVRWITETGDLAEMSSAPGTLLPGWLHLVLSWCPDQDLPEDPIAAACSPWRRGTLMLALNGRQVAKQSGVPELRFRDLSGPASQQYSVPYFLSWGGGPEGLRHAYSPVDTIGTPAPLNLADGLLETAFSGSVNVGLRRLRVYAGEVTPLGARLLGADYSPALPWGSYDSSLA